MCVRASIVETLVAEMRSNLSKEIIATSHVYQSCINVECLLIKNLNKVILRVPTV